jgi:hypothetical protein
MHHPFRFLSAMLLSAMLAASAASAQSADTGILGTVVDASGAVIPGSDITVTRVSTGVVQSLVSGPNGTFEVRYLVPGEYVVEARLYPVFITTTVATQLSNDSFSAVTS